MADLNIGSIHLLDKHHHELIVLAEAGQPQEICGIILCKNEISLEIIPIANISKTPNTNFLMAPEGLLKVFIQIDEENLEHYAFFHSHPRSLPVPSATDLAEAYYPDIPMIIIGRQNNVWKLKAYFLSKDKYQEIPIKIIS